MKNYFQIAFCTQPPFSRTIAHRSPPNQGKFLAQLISRVGNLGAHLPGPIGGSKIPASLESHPFFFHPAGPAVLSIQKDNWHTRYIFITQDKRVKLRRGSAE
jgi:hypothetical protein